MSKAMRSFTFQVDKNSNLGIDNNQVLFDNTSEIEVEPTNGIIETKGELILYTPNANFIGNDSFAFRKSNGEMVVVGIWVNEDVFKPRARLLLQLGDQLIRNESIALIELVKNSYDADAGTVIINMANVESLEKGIITIQDDGVGMNYNIVKNAWLEPGSDNKAKLVEQRIVTTKYKRLPIGEKGIGRFGVHKLGRSIELVSRMDGEDEVHVLIDWDTFSKYKYLNEAPVSVLVRKPEVFLGNTTGTKIIIRKIRNVWQRGMVRDVFRAINALATPLASTLEPQTELQFHEDSSFKPVFEIDNKEWLKGLLSWDKVKEYGLFFFDLEIVDSEIDKFIYKFIPWDRMKSDGILGRNVTIDDKPVSALKGLFDPSSEKRKKPEALSLKGKGIGRIKFRGCIFIRDKRVLKLAFNEPGPLSEYLNTNGGVRVYRDGLRVYDYGEPGNDWLSLDYRRFNNPGIGISNNMIIGAIDLDRKDSFNLIEKTNREGFIENQSYEIFKKSILYSLQLIEKLRRVDKNNIDKVYSPTSESEPVLQSIGELTSIIEEKIQSKELKKELKLYIDRIEKNYKFMNETLIKSASIGLSVGVVLHEVEKIILEIDKVLVREVSSDRVLKLVRHLSDLIENYSQVLRKTTRKDENLVQVLDQAMFNVEFRLTSHNIQLVKNYGKSDEPYKIRIARNLIIGTLMNIIDNSIYWLERKGHADKKIRIAVSKADSGYFSVIISDNGPGFALPTEEIMEPFVSGKPDGMGLGLHIAKEMMLTHNGKITFNEFDKYAVPDEYRSGATVILGFKY